MKVKAFTLIELLIVVAIIAILAAIAVPNFLEAQTRAKVSRTKADLRTLATGIESYKVDNTAGPSDAGNGVTPGIYRPYANPPRSLAFPYPNYSIGFELTTPIAYLTNASMIDPFKEADRNLYNNTTIGGREFYNFNNIAYRLKVAEGQGQTFAAYGVYAPMIGDWVLMGAGPDKYVNNQQGQQGDFLPSGSATIRGKNYDPTNGTVSNGDIYRSHKQGDGMPERGDVP